LSPAAVTQAPSAPGAPVPNAAAVTTEAPYSPVTATTTTTTKAVTTPPPVPLAKAAPVVPVAKQAKTTELTTTTATTTTTTTTTELVTTTATTTLPPATTQAPVVTTEAAAAGDKDKVVGTTLHPIEHPVVESDGPQKEAILQPMELARIMTQPSKIDGEIALYMTPAAWAAVGLQWPSDPKVAVQIKPLMDGIVENLLDSNMHTGAAEVGELQGLTSDPLEKLAKIRVQGDLANTGDVISKIQNNAKAVEAQIKQAFTNAHLTWSSYVEVNWYARFDFHITATGEHLRQRAGMKQGAASSSDGTPAVKVTDLGGAR